VFVRVRADAARGGGTGSVEIYRTQGGEFCIKSATTMQDPTDPLSPLGRKLLKLDPNAYGELVPRGSGNASAAAAAARDLL